MGLSFDCEVCWDYHCPNCIPQKCKDEIEKREKIRNLKRKAEEEEKIKIEKLKWEKQAEDKYQEMLERNGGITDFERLSKEKSEGE